MTRPIHELPALCRRVDKKGNRVRAYFTFQGKQYDCGRWGTPEATVKYHRLLDEVVRPQIQARLGTSSGNTTAGRAVQRSSIVDRRPSAPLAPAPTIASVPLLIVQLCADYWASIEQREERLAQESGQPRRKHQSFYAVRALSESCGKLLVTEFTPAQLIALRRQLVTQGGLNRGVANARVQQVIAVFRWGASRDLVPVDTYQRLTTVEPLKRGEEGARESVKQRPVSDDAVKATLPLLSPGLAAMVVVQLVTAMRPKELVELRGADLIRTNGRLVYCPRDHKNKHRGQTRAVPIPPHVEDLLLPYMTEDPEKYIFDPREEVAAQNAEKARRRKTKVQPSQRLRHERRVQNPANRLGEHYTTGSYAKAIRRACKRAKIDVWSPYQLRHAGATNLANCVDPVSAQALLGHRQITTTMIYVKPDCERATKALVQAHEADVGRIAGMKSLIPARRPASTQVNADRSTP